MKKAVKVLITLATVAALFLAGCSSSNGDVNSEESSGAVEDAIRIVWLPNESGSELGESRDALSEHIEEATGLPVEHELTTDYSIAIETIANGNADLGFVGGQAYVEANAQNESVQSLVVPSGESGTLEDALYYSWLNVKKGQEGDYQDGEGNYTIDNIEGQRMSFVSNSSTSGFVIPTQTISSHFSDQEISQEDLMAGGEDSFFSEVLFGGSHQGSAVNLLTDRADVAAFCDTCVANYVEPVEGEENEVGTTYQIKEDAADPFSGMGGEQFVSISVQPVLNSPIIYNSDNLSEDMVQTIEDLLTSEEVTNDERIWGAEDAEIETLFEKEGDSQFVPVEDEWFDPLRELQE